MKNLFKIRESGLEMDHLHGQVVRWVELVIVAIAAGSASAFFLWCLDRVTLLHWKFPWLLFFLPLAGMFVVWIYNKVGGPSDRGNNLIIDEIHEPGGGVPRRMAPLVLVATLVTHLFGGSAGREGTAVQMGGSIASAFARWFRLDAQETRILLMAGVAAGFGSVFGTPFAGAIFAMEVLVVGHIEYKALIPTLTAALIGHFTCSAWGIQHSIYHLAFSDPDPALGFHFQALLMAKIFGAAIAFGLASRLFSESAHAFQKAFKRIRWAPMRPLIGGVIVIALVYLVGSRDYLGLGVSSPTPEGVSILSAFEPGGAGAWSWWWKILFTVITLGCGFKGGEVTPLFFIGATLGNTLAWIFNAPVDLFAALGFVAVFAGATKTPLACTILGVELFGAEHAIYYAVACFFAYFFSGASGIYTSQRKRAPRRVEANPSAPGQDSA